MSKLLNFTTSKMWFFAASNEWFSAQRKFCIAMSNGWFHNKWQATSEFQQVTNNEWISINNFLLIIFTMNMSLHYVIKYFWCFVNVMTIEKPHSKN